MKVIATTTLMCGLLLIEIVAAQQAGPFGYGLGTGTGFRRVPGGFGRGRFINSNERGNFGVPANCPSACPAIYTPTCGFNGICYRSFGNSCELTGAACTGQGNFQQVPITECSRPGTRMC